MIIDHSNDRVLDVLESREKQVIREYLERRRAEGLLAQVVEVSSDNYFSLSATTRAVYVWLADSVT